VLNPSSAILQPGSFHSWFSVFSDEARAEGSSELGAACEELAGADAEEPADDGALVPMAAEVLADEFAAGVEAPLVPGIGPPDAPAPIVPCDVHAVSADALSASIPGITLARSRTVMIHPLWKAFAKPRLARGCRTI
jgi:hypothetical protein